VCVYIYVCIYIYVYVYVYVYMCVYILLEACLIHIYIHTFLELMSNAIITDDARRTP
jgi:hypothetical protein